MRRQPPPSGSSTTRRATPNDLITYTPHCHCTATARNGNAAIHLVSAWASQSGREGDYLFPLALKQESSVKPGVKNKCLKAGWDEVYLLKVLGHIAD